MTQAMTAELYWLAMTATLTALLWMPYILQFIIHNGLVGALMDAEGGQEHSAGWANRAKRAHYNAVENLVVFAPLVLMVQMLGLGDGTTAMAAMVFFWARLVHYIVYTLGIPMVRTAAFLVGFACQVIFALRVLGYM